MCMGCRGAAAYVELAEFGPPEYLHAAAAKLRPYPDLFVTGGVGVLLILGSVRTYLGMAAAATGHLDDAVRELRLGVESNDRAGTPPFAALARYQLAKALARRRRPGDREEALALTASAPAPRLGSHGTAAVGRRPTLLPSCAARRPDP